MMTSAEIEQAEEALRGLESLGFDVKAQWRELSNRVSEHQKTWRQPAPRATLDLSLDVVLAQASNPVLALVQRDLALSEEINRLSLDFDRLDQKLLRTTLTRSERKAIEHSMRRIRAELKLRESARRDALALRKKVVISERRKNPKGPTRR